MINKKKIFILIIWLLTILITLIWTYENPEKIEKAKDTLKYKFSVGKLFTNIKSKVINRNYKSIEEKKNIEIDSAYNTLNLNYFTIPTYSSYGGIAQIGQDILYLSGDSEIFLLKKILIKKMIINFKKLIQKK